LGSGKNEPGAVLTSDGDAPQPVTGSTTNVISVFAQQKFWQAFAETPFDRDPVSNARAIQILVSNCEREQRNAGRSWGYAITFCGCSADALRSHERIYEVPGEKQFCDAVAIYSEQSNRHLTPSQVTSVKALFALGAPKAKPRAR
jgi:hypothetical protein